MWIQIGPIPTGDGIMAYAWTCHICGYRTRNHFMKDVEPYAAWDLAEKLVHREMSSCDEVIVKHIMES